MINDNETGSLLGDKKGNNLTSTEGIVTSLSSNIAEEAEKKNWYLPLTVTISTAEVITSIFNLLVKYDSQLKEVIIPFTYFTYGTLTFLNLFVIKNSVDVIYRELQKKKNEIDRKIIASETITLISMLMWITVGITSILMLVSKGSQFESLNLCLGIIAPALGCISAVIRYFIEKEEAKKDNSKKSVDTEKVIDNNRADDTSIYAVIAVFECIHCVCHVMEAVQLNGKTQNIYEFNNIPVIAIQIVVGISLLALEINKNYPVDESMKKVKGLFTQCFTKEVQLEECNYR